MTRHNEQNDMARDDSSIKQTDVKKIAMAQWVMG